MLCEFMLEDKEDWLYWDSICFVPKFYDSFRSTPKGVFNYFS